MSLLDTVYTYKFIKALSTPWERQDAFKLGIIDKDGNILKKSDDLETKEEEKAYTPFHRLAWNIKKIVQKMPGGSSKLANYASALYLIKEQGATMGFSKENMSLFESAILTELNEEPTNVIGNAGDNSNIDTYDPLLGKKPVRRKKPSELNDEEDTDDIDADPEEYENRKNETPALANEDQLTEDLSTDIMMYLKTKAKGKPVDSDSLLRYMQTHVLKKIINYKHWYNAITRLDKKKAIKYWTDGHSSYIKLMEDMNEGDVSLGVFEMIKESMTRRKKRDAHGRVRKFYKRDQDCPPGQVKNREGGCEKIGGNRSLQQIKKTRRITQRKRKKTLKKKSNSFWRMADMRRKKTSRA